MPPNTDNASAPERNVTDTERLSAAHGREFDTDWTMVLAAQQEDSVETSEALETLCRVYWPAIYAYLRREGHQLADAQDLTQAFFARFLEKKSVSDVDRSKGRFRSFLLKTLNHFLTDQWRRGTTQRRGGLCPTISINGEEWEAVYGQELSSDRTPQDVFERRWARTLFAQALHRLRDEFVQAGKERQFELLKEFLSSWSASDGIYDVAAAELNVSNTAVALLVHRMRKRYGELVRDEVGHTVPNPAEVDEEIRHLLGVLGWSGAWDQTHTFE